MKPRTLTGFVAAFAVVGLVAVLISLLVMLFLSFVACFTSCYDLPGFLILYQTWWAQWNENIQTFVLLVILISMALAWYRRAEKKSDRTG